jgi:hypothetical protein
MAEMKIDQDGEEVIVYTREEIETRDAEIARLNGLNKEKTENFRRYNEMTQEERDNHSENELNLIRRNDILEAEIKGVKETLAEKETREKNEAKTNLLKQYHNDLPEVKTTLEEKYAMLAGMPENTPEEIRERTIQAARLAGISVDSVNPIYQSVNGMPPIYKEKTDYVETTAGKEAAALVAEQLGISQNK